ncbi:MAG: lipid IV(A) 3-deoxy-D-manno-octulosonic acid transferase [Methylococcales bacterium]|nr:lipid IV(A) 3-deoxy-D-manno-octulosonic acid transferase [Methylococcales bacterium]
MRVIYNCLFYSLTPFILLRLYWRGYKAPDYRLRWRERLGFYSQKSKRNVAWFHAVSVGEAEAVFPLIKQFMLDQPKCPILITTTTPTGSARVKAVMGNTVEHVYLPYDLPDVIKRFLNHFKPQKAIIMETEIWPNLFTLTAKQKIPLFIINARLSERSCRGYQKVSTLIEPALSAITLIATQTDTDKERFQAISSQTLNVQTMGNIKFDIQITDALIKQGTSLKTTLFANRFVWIIASTHKLEEQVFFKLYSELKQQIPHLLLLIVPRHPERFDEVAAIAKTENLSLVRRSERAICHKNTAVYLADTMGELKMLYAAADIAFVGGSLFKTLGGHNVLEPIAIGIPVMFGGFMRHFKAIETGILAAKAGLQCNDRSELINAVLMLYQNPEFKQQLINNADGFLKQNQGSIQKIIKQLIR